MRHPVELCIVEDDTLYRQSLDLVFQASEQFRIVDAFGEAEQALEALSECPTLAQRWNLVLMDLDLPGMGGTEATRRLRVAGVSVPIVVLTSFDDPPRIQAALMAGASGFLFKRATGDELCRYLNEALTGGAPLTPGVARSVVDLIRGAEPPPDTPNLAPREHDVLQALVRGRSYKQIAADLGLSIDTIRSYIRTLYRKLGVNSSTEAVSLALRNRWVT